MNRLRFVHIQIVKGIMIILVFGFLAAPSYTLASAFLFQNRSVAVPIGKSFSLPITVTPMGEKQYTVRFTIAFPPDKFEVTSFVFASSWIAVSQPGYDVIDNGRGELIKTAGFPRGFTSPQAFGTVTFRAKQAGDASIVVGPRSFVLNADSKNTLQSRPQVRVAVMEKSSTVESVPSETKFAPLPDLPRGEQNLFDIVTTPGQKAVLHPIRYIAIFVGIGMFFAVVMYTILVHYQHWRFNRKVKKN